MNNSFEPLTAQEMTATGAQKKSGKDDGFAIIPVPDDVVLTIPRHSFGEPAQVWKYLNTSSQLIFCVCRFLTADGKEDRPLTYRQFKDGSKRWCWKSVDTPRPLYGLGRLAARPDAPVIICEGEKAADAATNIFADFVAVTSPNGAGSPQCADWTPLRGRKVVIWPDQDDEGRKYAAAVAQLVIKVNKEKKS